MHDYSSGNQLKLTIKYENGADGKQQYLPTEIVSIYGYNNNLSIRKAILLVQYTILIRAIIRDVKEHTNDDKLKISRIMINDLLKFRTYFIEEMKSLDDEQLVRELDILDQFRYAEEI